MPRPTLHSTSPAARTRQARSTTVALPTAPTVVPPPLARGVAAGALAIGALAIGALAACGGSHQTSGDAAKVVAGALVTPSRGDSSGRPTAAAAAGAGGIVVPPDVSYATAESAYHARQYPTAAAMFEAYAARRPENPWGHYMRGLAAWKSGQLDVARRAFEDALTRDPKHARSLVNLSRVLLEQGQSSAALVRANEAIAVDSGLGEAWRTLGRVQARRGDVRAATDAYRHAIVLAPTDVWAMNDMGLLLIDVGRYADAIGPLARAVQLDSTVPTFANNLGIALERSGHLTAAATAYRLALAADSGYARARVSLERVGDRSDAAGVSPIDLSAAAAAFAVDLAGTTRTAGPA